MQKSILWMYKVFLKFCTLLRVGYQIYAHYYGFWKLLGRFIHKTFFNNNLILWIFAEIFADFTMTMCILYGDARWKYTDAQVIENKKMLCCGQRIHTITLYRLSRTFSLFISFNKWCADPDLNLVLNPRPLDIPGTL